MCSRVKHLASCVNSSRHLTPSLPFLICQVRMIICFWHFFWDVEIDHSTAYVLRGRGYWLLLWTFSEWLYQSIQTAFVICFFSWTSSGFMHSLQAHASLPVVIDSVIILYVFDSRVLKMYSVSSDAPLKQRTWARKYELASCNVRM